MLTDYFGHDVTSCWTLVGHAGSVLQIRVLPQSHSFTEQDQKLLSRNQHTVVDFILIQSATVTKEVELNDGMS